MSANTAVKDLGVRVGKRTCRAAVDAKVLLWLFIFITHFKRMNVETITRNDLKVEKTKYVTLKLWTRVDVGGENVALSGLPATDEKECASHV